MPNIKAQKELAKLRRSENIRQLALSEEHERTHTGSAVLRKSRLKGHYVNTMEDTLANTPLEPLKVTPEELQEEVLHEATLLTRGWIDAGLDFPMYQACTKVAARYGLKHSQVPALVDDVLQFIGQIQVKKFTRKV